MKFNIFSQQNRKGQITFDGATVKGAMEKLRVFALSYNANLCDFHSQLFSLIAVSNEKERAALSRVFLCYVIAWERFESTKLSEIEFFKQELSE